MLSRTKPPSLRSPARFIPRGFQPIAGGERSVTTGSRTPVLAYPEGIAALRALASASRLESLRDTGTCGEDEPVVSLRSTTGYGLRPLRGGEWADSASNGDHTPSEIQRQFTPVLANLATPPFQETLMEVKRWHTLAALVCSLSLQAVALAQKPEVRTIIETLVSEDAPQPTDEKKSDEVDQPPIPNKVRIRIAGPEGTTLEATQITIQLPNGETRVIAVPTDDWKSTADALRQLDAEAENRTAPKFVIGVSLSEVPDSLRAHVTLPEGGGLMVGSLFPDSPAAKAGLMQYDLLLKCGEKDLHQPKDLQEIVDASEGKAISLTLQRKGEQKTIEVTPIKREDAKFAMNESAQQSIRLLQNLNGQGALTYWLAEGQLPPGGFNLTANVPMPPMITPPAATQQLEALTESIRQLTEQVERLQGSIDKLEKQQGEGEVDDKK